MLRHLHENIPGIEVDQNTFDRMEGLEGDEARAAGVDIAADVVRRLREVPGVAGVHVMAPGWEAEAVPRVVRAAGLGAGGESLDRD
jgi:methylenetetrahydrofolate reductase (NADPH)